MEPEQTQEVNADYTIELAQVRNLERAYGALENLRSEGQSFGHPSYLKYAALIILALANDGVDALQLTGVLSFISWTVSAALGAVIVLIYWLTDTPHKKANNFVESLGTRLGEIEKGIARAAIITKKTGVRLGSQKLIRLGTKLSGKNPIIKAIIGAVGGIVLPVQTIF